MLFTKKFLEEYRKTAFSRADGDGLAFYFTHTDFPGLGCEAYPFPSRFGHTLAGKLYSYENPIPNRLIVFDHGFGGGHLSYMREIETLCRHGYLVLAYDHTGCMESGGEGTRGLSGSITDLDDCLFYVKRDTRFAGYSLAVVGHSWGGYATILSPALHPELTHIVILAGAVSAKRVLRGFLHGPLALFRPAAFALERKTNPNTVNLDGARVLAETKTRVLGIFSENDPLIPKHLHYDPLEKALAGKENARMILLPNKGHNPNYTDAAVLLLGAYLKEKNLFLKEHPQASAEEKAAFVARFDFRAMTEQDEGVWQEIFAWLDN